MVVKWHSLSLIVSYLVSFRLLLKILTGCHLLTHSKFILWNALFLSRAPPPPRFRGLRRVERWRVKARLVTKCCEWSPQHSVMSFTWKNADITRLLGKRHSAQREAAAVQILSGSTLRVFNWVESVVFVRRLKTVRLSCFLEEALTINPSYNPLHI